MHHQLTMIFQSNSIRRRIYRYKEQQQVRFLRAQVLVSRLAKEEAERQSSAILRENKRLLFAFYSLRSLRDKERAESNMKIRKLSGDIHALRHFVSYNSRCTEILQLTTQTPIYTVYHTDSNTDCKAVD